MSIAYHSSVLFHDILSNLNLAELNQKYDLVFIDPPFKEKKIKHLILNIYKSEILSSSGIIIIHRNSKWNDVFPKELNILEKKTYGVSQIFFCSFV